MEVKHKKKLMMNTNICPFCGGRTLKRGDFENVRGLGWRDTTCIACGDKWREVYKLTEIEGS